MRLSILLFLTFWGGILAFSPTSAWALEEEVSSGAGLFMATHPDAVDGSLGFGSSLHARYGLSDTFSLNVGLLYTHHAAFSTHPDQTRPSLDIFVPHLGFLYAVDVIEIVPYIIADATLYASNREIFGDFDRYWGAGFLLGLGLDYRGWKTFSIGLEISSHTLASDLAKDPSTQAGVNFHFSYHFEDDF